MRIDARRRWRAALGARLAMTALAAPRADAGHDGLEIDPHRLTRVASIHYYGRSGSVFLQSLLDSHPDVLMLPAVYLCGFHTFWDRFGGIRPVELVAAFVHHYPVIFDPTSTEEVIDVGRGIGLVYNFNHMGEGHDERLGLDRAAFAQRLLTKCALGVGPESGGAAFPPVLLPGRARGVCRGAGPPDALDQPTHRLPGTQSAVGPSRALDHRFQPPPSVRALRARADGRAGFVVRPCSRQRAGTRPRPSASSVGSGPRPRQTDPQSVADRRSSAAAGRMERAEHAGRAPRGH